LTEVKESQFVDPTTAETVAVKIHCPQCGSHRYFRNGHDGDVQRYICRDCCRRFRASSVWSRNQNLPDKLPCNLKGNGCITDTSQLCAQKEAKKLTTATEAKTGAGEITQCPDTKGKIVEFSFWMLKQGYSKATIKTRTKIMKRLVRLETNLTDPESVKETIAKQQWSTGRKGIAVDAYTCFLQMQGLKWNPPFFKRIRKLPFIPTENEIDQLIGGCNRRMATFLQLLKETGVRCGEASQLLWTDVDTVDGSVIVTPEKASNTRKLKISNKLLAMLSELPKESKTVFNANSDAMRKSFTLQRRHMASKLKNPRLTQITFHTFRHWKATTEYHKTKDILHVMQMLGHKSINNTLVYTRLIDFRDDDYTARIARSEQEACKLIEGGFEFVCDFNGNKVFRKRR